MRWEEERYVRLYTRDTPDWCVLSWEARALWCLILRKLDRAGILDLGRHGVRGLAAIVQMPPDVVERALPELVADGCVTIRDSLLVAPNFMAAQESKQSDAARQRASREKARAVAIGEPLTNRDAGVTKRDDSGDSGHAESHGVTVGHSVPSLAVPDQIPPTPPAGGGDGSDPDRQIPEPASPLGQRLAAYAGGIRTETGKPWTIAPDAADRKALQSAGFLLGCEGERLLAALGKSAARYRRERADRAEFERGFRPAKWAEWLQSLPAGDAGVDADRKPPPRAPIAPLPPPPSRADLAAAAVLADDLLAGIGNGGPSRRAS